MAVVVGVKCGGEVYGEGHDCNAALFDDRRIVAIQAERLDRIRKSEGWIKGTIIKNGMGRHSPEFVGCRPSVEYCLDAAAATPDDVGLVVCDNLSTSEQQQWELSTIIGESSRMIRISHHLAHAASAFYCSSFDSAAILVVDGSGGRHPQHRNSFELQSAFTGSGLDIKRLWTTWSNVDSDWGIGGAYSLHEQILKMEAGKLMGLASYGSADNR